MPAGGDDDRRSGPVGVGAPHRLDERAVRVAREVVREDDLWVAGAFRWGGENEINKGVLADSSRAIRVSRVADKEGEKKVKSVCN